MLTTMSVAPQTTAKPQSSEHAALVAARTLCRIDPPLGRLIRRIGPYRPIITPDPFHALVCSILQQQISMTAADSIRRKLLTLCGGSRFTPRGILARSEPELRKAGLSGQKAAYVRDVAAHFADGRLSARMLRSMSDEEVVAATTRIKGVGKWTAEMLLIFCLERPDVWPIDDLGLRKAVRNFLRLRDLPDAESMRLTGEPWRPFRTYASWYLWRSLEGPLMPGIPVGTASRRPRVS